MAVKKQHAPDLMSGGAIRDGKGRIIDQTYALKTEVLAGSTNVTEGTFDELPANPNEGDIHILTEPYIDSDYTEGLVDPKLERVKYHTGTEFVKGENNWNRISNTGNKVNEWDYQVKTHFIPSTGVVKIARIAQFSNITFRAIYNVPAPSKETSSCTITFAGGSAIGRADNKSAVTNLCFYKQGTTNYLCIKPNGLATITIDLYDVKFYRGSLTPIEPEALTSEQIKDVTYFTELGESKEIVIDPTDTDNVLTLGLRKESQDDNTAYLDFNANSGIQSIDIEKGLYHIVNTTIFEQSVFYWNGKTCYRLGGNYTTPVEVSDIDSVRLDLDYINPGTYYFVNTKPINNGLTITSYRDISTLITNSLDELIPANTTIGFTITEDNISFFKKNQGEYVKTVSGCYPDEEGDVNIDDHFVTITTPQRILGEKKFTYNTYVEHLYFGTGVITGDTALLESDSGENLRLINSKLRLSRSGNIQLRDDYAVTGDVVYNYINNNVVTLNGNQTIVGTKNFEDLEVNNSIKFNSGLGATPVGTIEVNNNQLKVTDAKLELEESGNIANGDNYAVNANAVKTFVDGEISVITLTEEQGSFNFNNPGNFPEQNKIKKFITIGWVDCVSGPYNTLSHGTIIEFCRSGSYEGAQTVVQRIISDNDEVIYERTVDNIGSGWHANSWILLSNNLHVVNKGYSSIAHKENTYNDSVSNTSNTILGTNNVFFNGSNNFTVGCQHQINGNNNVAGGISNNIAYSYAAVFGGYNVIKNNGASAFGMWSNTDANSYFTIGNGTDVSNRSNLLDIKTNGDIIIKYNGEDTVLQSIIGSGIDESTLVHKAGYETIIGQKVFDEITTFKDIIYLYNETKTTSIAIKYVKDDNTNAIQIGNNNTNVKGKSGLIESGNLYFVTGGTVYTALQTKANDSTVVHKTEDENIVGQKTFINTRIPITIQRTSDAIVDLSILVDADNNPNLRRYNTSSVSQNILLKSDRIEFKDNLNTINGYVNSNSNLNQDWTSNQIPTKNAIKLYVESSISTKADDSNVVHKTGDETVNGIKSFADTIKFGSGSSTVNLVKNGTIMELQKSAMLRLQRVYENSERHIALHVYGSTDGTNTYPRLVAQSVDTSGDTPVPTETTSVALRDDKVSFALNRTTEWGFINDTSNSNENWNTKEIPTKNAVATKISAEISNATDVYCINLTYSGSDSGYLDHTLTEHHRTTYIYVSSDNAPGIQIIAPYPQKGDIIIVDTGNINTTHGNGCFPPVLSTNDSKYHYWPSSKSYLNVLKDVTDAVTINIHAKLKWWYDGTNWELIENVISGGV